MTGLAAGERRRPQSTARTVGALESAGLITRSRHPAARRRTMIALTDTGRAVIARDAWPARAMAAVLWPPERDLLVRAGEPMDRPAGYAGVPEGV